MTKEVAEITLKKPFKLDGKQITKLKIRMPGAGDMRGLMISRLVAMDFDHLTDIIPRICVTPHITSDMISDSTFHVKDVFQIGEALTDFFVT